MIEVLHLRKPPTLGSRVLELRLTGGICRVVASIASSFMGPGIWAAMTLPLPFVTLIVYNGDIGALDPLTRVHEFVHVEQRERAGSWWRAVYRYVREYVRSGYKKNVYEIEAQVIEILASSNGLPDWALEGTSQSSS